MAAQRRHGASPPESEAPAATLRLRAAQVIDAQRAKIFAHVAAAVEGRDPEGVHDMRVATRRLRASLALFAPWLDEGDVARIAPAVRTLTRALGRVRELDVLRLRLAELAATATPQRALAIECIDARLVRRRSRARARMMARFAKVDLDRLEGRLQRLATQLARPVPPAAGGDAPPLDVEASNVRDPGAAGAVQNDAIPAALADPPIAELLAAIARDVLEEARDVAAPSLPDEVGTAAACEALHAVRIAAKKLRYALEIVAPYLGDGGASAVRRLRAAQDRLGDFHDDVVLDDTLRPAIDRALERGRPLLAAELRALRASRRRALLRDERAVRRAIAKLAEDDFVGLLAATLAAAGVTVPEVTLAAPPERPTDAPASPATAADEAPDAPVAAPRRGRARGAAAQARGAS